MNIFVKFKNLDKNYFDKCFFFFFLRHAGERRVRGADEEADFKQDFQEASEDGDQEIALDNSDDETKNEDGVQEGDANEATPEDGEPNEGEGDEESLFPDTKIAVDHLVKNV